MAYQPATNVVSVLVRLSGGGPLQQSNAAFRLYLLLTAAPTPANVAAVATAGAASATSALLPLLSGDWVIDDVIAKDLTVEGGAESIAPVALPGTRAGTSLPASASMLVRYRAAAGGPETRGRVYLPIGVEGDSLGNDWPVGFRATALAAFQSFVDALEASVAGAQLCVVSRFEGMEDVTVRRATRRPGNATVTVATILQERGRIASQRNRIARP